MSKLSIENMNAIELYDLYQLLIDSDQAEDIERIETALRNYPKNTADMLVYNMIRSSEPLRRLFYAQQVMDLPEEQKNKVFTLQGQKLTILFFLIESYIKESILFEWDFINTMLERGFDLRIIIDGSNIYNFLFSMRRTIQASTKFNFVLRQLLFLWPMEESQLATLTGFQRELVQNASKKSQPDFKILEFLGQGKYGKVYKVDKGGEICALKVFKSNLDEGIPEIGEIDLLSKFEHACILKAISFEVLNMDARKSVGIVLPLAETDLFGAIIERNPSADVKKKWIFQLISGIHFLHKNGFYHCDLKPENTLIINTEAVISDFGFAGNENVHSRACQTLNSPQLFYKKNKDLSKIGPRLHSSVVIPTNEKEDDMWALGITILFMVAKNYYFYNSFPDELMINPKALFESVIVDMELKDFVLPILVRLIDVYPEVRSFHLIELLELPIFEGRDNFIDGTVKEVDNTNPVMFEKEDVKQAFAYTFRLFSEFFISPRATLLCIDLFYRVFMHFFAKFKHQVILQTVVLIITKLVNEEFPVDFMRTHFPIFDTKIVLNLEQKIVKFVNGNITRKSLIDTLPSRLFPTAVLYIAKHFEDYETHSLDILTKTIKNLS